MSGKSPLYVNDIRVHTGRLALEYYGGVKVSTGVWKSGKRAAVGSDCVKKDPLKRNAKTNNNYALAA